MCGVGTIPYVSTLSYGRLHIQHSKYYYLFYCCGTGTWQSDAWQCLGLQRCEQHSRKRARCGRGPATTGVPATDLPYAGRHARPRVPWNVEVTAFLQPAGRVLIGHDLEMQDAAPGQATGEASSAPRYTTSNPDAVHVRTARWLDNWLAGRLAK